jgi:hypothetical protein
MRAAMQNDHNDNDDVALAIIVFAIIGLFLIRSAFVLALFEAFMYSLSK